MSIVLEFLTWCHLLYCVLMNYSHVITGTYTYHTFIFIMSLIRLELALELAMGMLNDPHHPIHNPWSHANEKSAAAQGRENQARWKFDHLNNQMDLALYENTMTTIGLACHAKSDSPLKLLPPGVMNSILAFVGCTKPGLMPGVKASLDRRTNNNAIVPFAGLGTPESQLNLGDVSLFHPGEKIVIPFSKVSMIVYNMHNCLQV